MTDTSTACDYFVRFFCCGELAGGSCLEVKEDCFDVDVGVAVIGVVSDELVSGGLLGMMSTLSDRVLRCGRFRRDSPLRVEIM